MKVKVISLPYIFQVLYVLCFTRSRYQVSVYRTNGPLVYLLRGGRHACQHDENMLLSFILAILTFTSSVIQWLTQVM